MENSHNLFEYLPITKKYYELYRASYRWIKTFPKKERYTLGEKIESGLLSLLFEAHYLNQLPNALKENRLLVLSAKNDVLKIIFRLALDTGMLNFAKYETAQNILQEAGKMIGGWIKFARNKK